MCFSPPKKIPPFLVRFVRSRDRTPNSVHVLRDETRDEVEVSPKSGLAVREMCRRVAEDGGAALIADYGEAEGEGDTFRAFKKHRCGDALRFYSINEKHLFPFKYETFLLPLVHIFALAHVLAPQETHFTGFQLARIEFAIALLVRSGRTTRWSPPAPPT